MLIFEIPEAYSELQFSSLLWIWLVLLSAVWQHCSVYVNLCWSLSTKDPNQPSRPIILFCFSRKCCRYIIKLCCTDLVEWMLNNRLFQVWTRLNSSSNIQKEWTLTKINLMVWLPFQKTLRVSKQAKCQFIGIFFFFPSSNFSKIISMICTTKYESGEFLCFIA